jgi:transposase
MDTSILGIDVASRKLDLCWSTQDRSKQTTLEYTNRALDAYLSKHTTLTPDRCTIGLESTGDYHIAAGKFFLKRGFVVRLINPMLTRYYTRLTIRGTKTDARDAALICKLIAEGHGEPLTLATLANRDRELLRLANMLIQTSVQLTQRLQSTHRKGVGHTDRFERKIDRIVTRLHTVADELVAEATAAPSEPEQLIRSIPGFGAKLAAIVHHELGDISRFKNAKSLVAYAGLDPRIRQSGALLNTTGHLTKRGSTTLRHALFLAANITRQYDAELADYYAHKRAEGRSHREVLCIISRKLLYRINTVLRSHRPYYFLKPAERDSLWSASQVS